jgi:hypothetical protein
MAKGRVGVLEAHEASESIAPQTHCGRAIAEILIRERSARQIGKRLIQMISAKAADAIRQAKTIRDEAQRKFEAKFEALCTTKFAWWDGPLGRGNVLPFAKSNNYGDKLHYEIPMANDIGMRRHGLYRRDGKLLSHRIRVSARPQAFQVANLAAQPI